MKEHVDHGKLAIDGIDAALADYVPFTTAAEVEASGIAEIQDALKGFWLDGITEEQLIQRYFTHPQK